MQDPLQQVAIIGAGLGGCALALALSQRGIPVHVYEARPQTSDVINSGIILTPNGLHILDRLGVLARIQDRCYKTTHRVFKNREDETTKKVQISGEAMYGYANHRVWRSVLLDEMKQMLAERSVRVEYESKFGGIESDSPDGVVFKINGNSCSASLLIGVDGIYSTIRKYLAPEVQPEYTGTMGVISHVQRGSVAWPHDDYELNATIQDKPGAIFFLPEDPEATDIMIGMQKRSPEYSREELEELQRDKEKLVGFYTEHYEQWGPTARSIIDQVVANKERCFIWPFLRVPTLPQWYSSTGRVLLCGDAAHGLPPSSGQGVNQALEDIYSLALLLDSTRQQRSKLAPEDSPASGLLNILEYWQQARQKRVDEIFDWATNSTNVQRMSEDERRLLREQDKPVTADRDDMSWLYTPSLESDVQKWIETRS